MLGEAPGATLALRTCPRAKTCEELRPGPGVMERRSFVDAEATDIECECVMDGAVTGGVAPEEEFDRGRGVGVVGL